MIKSEDTLNIDIKDEIKKYIENHSKIVFIRIPIIYILLISFFITLYNSSQKEQIVEYIINGIFYSQEVYDFLKGFFLNFLFGTILYGGIQLVFYLHNAELLSKIKLSEIYEVITYLFAVVIFIHSIEYCNSEIEIIIYKLFEIIIGAIVLFFSPFIVYKFFQFILYIYKHTKR